MNAELLKLIVDAIGVVADSDEDSEAIRQLQIQLSEHKNELAAALQELEEVERPDGRRTDDELRNLLGTIGTR